MIHTDLTLTPRDASDSRYYLPVAAQKAGIILDQIVDHAILHKSVDARGREIVVNMRVALFMDGDEREDIAAKYNYKDVSDKPSVVVVGMGPAGLFAALRLIELGKRPIVLERGKCVKERKRDIALLNLEHLLDEDSNYCYGEGGAGTFSDGKLYTRSNKRGDISRILEIFNIHGADDSILYDARPHIGTDKLPKIVATMRETILRCGGEVHFSTRLDDIRVEGDKITAVVTSKGNEIPTSAVILATGHSAEDVYRMLQRHGVRLEAKGFAMGVRVEHPRELIDEIRYHKADMTYLPTASYNVATQVDGRGVYSFCMCPGGQIVPSATSKGQTVVNGMSAAARRNRWSNAAIVVEIRQEDIPNYSAENPLCGLEYQKQVEQMTYINGGSCQSAPAQRLTDFVKGRISSSLPETSYVPGIVNSPVHFWLPEFIGNRLRQGFKDFDKKMHGFLTEEAQVLASETRTSSPVRIVRDEERMCSVTIQNLFPCGEGAGYAGGIVSSAMDGEKAAEAVFSTKI
ncbi:MAG: NAD(P)/FAD-dependent oxidoreductase [Bacteroidales bacterium]|nr:NAD(P)/FAD-dependent oxidoreductase [Bacteroidales bacterium]